MAKQILKVDRRKKIGFTIDPKIFDELIKFQNDLPSAATGSNKNGGMTSHSEPAGLALLGIKDNKIDMIVPLEMSGGCWDAPNINYNDMYKGFQSLLDQDRICSGMALVRNPTWQSYNKVNAAQIPGHLSQQLHTLKNSFEDITRTLWIIVHNGHFRIYRPYISSDGHLRTKETLSTSFFDGEEINEVDIIKNKIKHDLLIRKQRKIRKLAKIERDRKYREEQERINIEMEKEAVALHEKKAQKLLEINNKVKESTEETIDIGNGYIFMKNNEGKYILWKTQ